MINRKSTLKSLLVTLTVTLPALGIGVPHLDIAKLVSASDVIVVADVSPARLVGPAAPIEFNGKLLTTREFEVALKVRRFIKGRCPEYLTIRYTLPDPFMGYLRLQTGLRMVFLRNDNNEYVLTNPYYPELPAANGEPTSSNTPDSPLAAVLRELADVLAFPAHPQDRVLVLQKDYAIPTSDYLISAIKRGIATAPDAQTREVLQGELLRRDDLSELPKASSALRAGTVTPEGKNALLYAIGNKIKDSRAAPELLPLLAVRDSAIRVAAAEALWHIAAPSTTTKIVPLLDDPEPDVRYYATRALADITGQNLWGPSIPEFQENGRRYLEHWRDWAKQNGYLHD